MMLHFNPRAAALVLAAGFVLAGSTAARAVSLRFTPADTNIAPGASGRLAVVIDDAVTIRTIDVTVTYDTTVVRSVGGGPGLLYTDSGLNTFQGWEEEVPGSWHGYAVILGDSVITGPGELYTWDLHGLEDGVSPVIAVQVYVSDIDAEWYSEVVLPQTTIVVGDGLSAVEGPPAPIVPLRLQPNPFNPRTEVLVEMTTAGQANVAVYDLRGRRVALLFAGNLATGPFHTTWDGRDDAGAPAPGGVYLFRMTSGQQTNLTKGLLLK